MNYGIWTKDDLRTLKKIFPGRSTSDVAKELGRGVEAVKKKASRLGLRKSRGRMKKLGKA